MTLRTFHPWSSVEEITTATAFELEVSPTVGQSRLPTPAEAALLDEVDPTGVRFSEVKDD
jgi:hypothetical protein